MDLLETSMSTAGLAGLCVCMVGPHYPRYGGVSTQVELLSEFLRAEGAEIRSVDTNIRSLRRLGRLGRLLLPMAQVVVVAVRLWRACAGADLVHTHLASYWGFYLPMGLSLVVGRLRNIPLVVTFHGGKAAQFVARHQRWVRAMLGPAAALITLSPFTGQVFEAIGLQPVTIPNVVALDRFKPAADQGANGTLGADPTLLWVKTFDSSGNPLAMVRIFARLKERLPGARLIMVGDGRLRPESQSLATSLGVNILFPGRVPYETMPGIFAGSDIFVSSSALDNQPSTLLEASACGLPIVVTAVGGVPYMVEDDVSALLVPPGEFEPFVEAILRVVEEPGLASWLGKAATENAQRYAWPAVGAQLSELYQQVIQCHNRGGYPEGDPVS